MTSIRSLCAAVLASVWLSCSLAFAAESSSAALALVKKLRLDDNLTSMSNQVASRTQTYLIIVQTVGAEKAQLLVKDELDKVRPKYQEQWDKNLAASYAEFFTPNELESIAEKQKASPYASKFLLSQGIVGQSMQTKSTDLLKDFVAEALMNAFTKIVPKK